MTEYDIQRLQEENKYYEDSVETTYENMTENIEELNNYGYEYGTD